MQESHYLPVVFLTWKSIQCVYHSLEQFMKYLKMNLQENVTMDFSSMHEAEDACQADL